MKPILYLVLLLLIPATVMAGVPSKIRSALKKVAPEAVNPDWTMNGNYFVADFMSKGFEKNVWLDAKGNWIMTQTDLQTMDEVPAAVYNTFSFGYYADAPVSNVILAEFPKCPAVIVVKVGEYNMDVYYYLFYSLQGNLSGTYNANDFDTPLGPEVFNCP